MHLGTRNEAATHGVSPRRLSREHVTHTEAIAHLLAPSGPEGARTAAVRDAVVAHVARCSDCWRLLAALEVTDPTDAREMAAHFGCETVQDTMFALVDLAPAAIAREHGGVAQHLAWCLACRSRFAEIVEVERERSAQPRWIELGEQVREAVGRLVVRLGRAAAGLVEVPDGFVLGPALAPVPLRGGEPAGAPTQSARFELGDTGVWAELAVDEADAAAGLSLRLVSPATEPLSVRVREARAEGETLVARYTLRGTEPVLVRGLWPGTFVVELHDARDAVHRVRLDVGS